MTKKEDNELWTYGALGVAASALIGLVISALGKSPPNFSSNPQVNSYQSEASYSPPPPPKSGGCGCSAGR